MLAYNTQADAEKTLFSHLLGLQVIDQVSLHESFLMMSVCYLCISLYKTKLFALLSKTLLFLVTRV